MLAHDLDDPKNELFDLRNGSLKGRRARDVHACGRGQLADQLVQVHEPVVPWHLRLRLWGSWRTSFERFDETTELRFLVLVEVRTDSCNVRLECHLRATMATEHGKNLTTTTTNSRVRGMAPHHIDEVLVRIRGVLQQRVCLIAKQL